MTVSLIFEFSRATRSGSHRPPRVHLYVDPELDMSHNQPAGSGSQGQGNPPSSHNVPSTSTTTNATLNQLLPKGTISLPEFTGTPETRVHASHFLARVERVFTLERSLPEYAKLVAVQSCFPLSSPASTWYQLKFHEFSTLDDFVEAFKKRFGASDIDTSYLRRQFRRFRQHDGDTVNKYYTALLQLSSQIALNGAGLSDNDIVDQFVHGLKPALSDLVFHEQIRAGRTYTLDEIVKIAEDIERSERLKNRKIPAGASGKNVAPQANALQKTGKYCAYHKSTSHNTDDCKRVIQLKKEGKWRGKPADKAQAN